MKDWLNDEEVFKILGEEINVDDKTSEEEDYSKFDTNKLCEIVACHRYLGCFKDKAIKAMKELVLRRANGDTSEFEKIIDNMKTSLPNFNLNGKSLFNSVKNAKY